MHGVPFRWYSRMLWYNPETVARSDGHVGCCCRMFLPSSVAHILPFKDQTSRVQGSHAPTQLDDGLHTALHPEAHSHVLPMFSRVQHGMTMAANRGIEALPTGHMCFACDSVWPGQSGEEIYLWQVTAKLGNNCTCTNSSLGLQQNTSCLSPTLQQGVRITICLVFRDLYCAPGRDKCHSSACVDWRTAAIACFQAVAWAGLTSSYAG